MRKIATGRVIGLTLVLVSTAIAIKCAVDAVRRDAEFYEWVDARPMQVDIDLSQTGTITTPFEQTCSISHGEGLYLDLNHEMEDQAELRELLDGLSGTVAIDDADGNQIETVTLIPRAAYLWDKEVMLTEISPFARGDYTATVTIDSPAPALAGREQTLYAAYHLCGLERMPVMISGAAAAVAGLIALGSAVFVLPRLWLFGVWKADATADG